MKDLLEMYWTQLKNTARQIMWGSAVGLIFTVLMVGFFAAAYLFTKIHFAIAVFLMWLSISFVMGGKVMRHHGSLTGDDADGRRKRSTYSR